MADLITAIGACAFVFGLYLYSLPLACIVGGLLLVGLGANLGKQKAHEAKMRKLRGEPE